MVFGWPLRRRICWKAVNLLPALYFKFLRGQSYGYGLQVDTKRWDQVGLQASTVRCLIVQILAPSFVFGQTVPHNRVILKTTMRDDSEKRSPKVLVVPMSHRLGQWAVPAPADILGHLDPIKFTATSTSRRSLGWHKYVKILISMRYFPNLIRFECTSYLKTI